MLRPFTLSANISVVPTGLGYHYPAYPALKRWPKLGRPFGAAVRPSAQTIFGKRKGTGEDARASKQLKFTALV